MQKENISQIAKKKMTPLTAGILTVVVSLSLGASIGIVTGVIKVPFAEACCVLPPPVIVPPPIIVVPPTVILTPSCELDVTATTADTATLSWISTNVVDATIDNGIGGVPLIGSITVTPSVTTTYTMIVTGPGGQAPCSATVTVTPPVTPPPTCTLTATSPIASGSASTLSWTTTNSSSFTLDHAIGSVTPVSGGSVLAPAITADTVYSGVAHGVDGTDVTCTAPVTVTPPVTPPPTCTLTANLTAVHSGDAVTLTWTTQNTVSVHLVPYDTISTPVHALNDSVIVHPTTDTTYTLTANDGAVPNNIATCTVAITVAPQGAPICTLSVSPTSYAATTGAPTIQPTLSWTTQNATSFVIDHAVGSVTPVATGSQLAPAISVTTTYSGVATGPAGNSQPCTATIVVTPPPQPNAPICTLTAVAPTSFVNSGTPTLTWTTANATSFVIDNGVGSVTPVAIGTTTAAAITTTTTYTGIATGPGGNSLPCTATFTVTPGGSNPPIACTLNALPTDLGRTGGPTVLSWTTTGATSFSIDNNIGSVTPVAIGSTTTGTITSNTTFTGTATDGVRTVSCTAAVTVQTGGGGCVSNCGGGGGSHPHVTLDVFTPQALGFVYLSQIPYTGLDLGPIGTVVYWIVLVVWSLALAYLVLFVALPYLGRRMQRFGTDVKTALNNAPQPAFETVVAYSAPVGAPQVHKSVASEPRQHYSNFDGFRSFAKGEALSIDDIVNGLAREHAAAPEPVVVSERVVSHNVEPIYENVEPIRAAAPKQEAAPVHPDVPAFLHSLINAEREAVFGMFREIVRAGADAEAFLTQVACALDDAYRARLEGTPVHAEVKRITDPVSTNVLEKLVTSLASAVDSSYSVGITGAKLALTRALATVGA